VITHEMGNAKPPAARYAMVLEWTSKLPGEEPKEKTVAIPRGWEVREGIRSEYWVAHKMHTAFAALARANGVPLSKEFFLFAHGEPVGCGEYASEDPHHRAFSDCTIREAEWELHGQDGPLLTVAVNMDGIPDDQLNDMARRTGSRNVAVEV
jgi:hypothetical protein